MDVRVLMDLRMTCMNLKEAVEVGGAYTLLLHALHILPGANANDEEVAS